MQTYTIDIRPRRQITFPKSILEKLGIGVGDSFVAEAKDATIILKPRKQAFLDLLKEMERIVKESGIPEAELQEAAKNYRRQKTLTSYAATSIS